MTGTPQPHPTTDPLEVPLERLRRRTSEKWRHYEPDVLPVFVAEMDVDTPAPVVAAVTAALADGDTGYQAGSRYQRAFATFARERWGWAVDVSRTTTSAGVMHGALALIGLLTAPGGAVVVNTPVYPPFLDYPRAAGREVVTAPLGTTGRLDLDVLERAFTVAASRGPAVYLLCSPHNPTGTVHTREELEAVVALARRHGVTVVADEIHAPLTYVPFTPLLTVTDDAYSLVSASKAWNLAGFSASLVVAGAAAPRRVTALPPFERGTASHLGVVAHSAALEEGGPWLDDLLASLVVRRGLLADLLAEHLPQVRWTPPEATYLAWLDCRALLLDEGLPGAEARAGAGALRPPPSAGQVPSTNPVPPVAAGTPRSPEPAKVFASRGRVALSPGRAFDAPGFARLNFAASTQVLTEAVRRMAGVVSGGVEAGAGPL